MKEEMKQEAPTFLETKDWVIFKEIIKPYDCTFYAYGSRVKGDYSKFSDLDLCVMGNADFNQLKEDFYSSNLPMKVDVKELSDFSPSFFQLIKDDFLLLQPSSDFLEIEQNTFGHFKYLPDFLGFPVEKTDDTLTINCGLGSSMFNIVCDTKFQQDQLDFSINRLTIQLQGQPFACWLGPSTTPKNLKQILPHYGFISETTEYAMMSHNPGEISTKNSLQIRMVNDSKDIQNFISVIEPYDATARPFYEALTEPSLSTKEKLFVGYEGEIPVTIGLVYIDQNMAGIFSLLTLEGKRGSGYGTEMMQHIINYSQQKGISSFYLSASSESGFRIYERFGFKVVGLFDCFEKK